MYAFPRRRDPGLGISRKPPSGQVAAVEKQQPAASDD